MDRRHLVSPGLRSGRSRRTAEEGPSTAGRGRRLLLVGLILAALPGGAFCEESAGPFDPALIAAVDAIRDAFRLNEAAALAALLPAPGKTHIAVKVITPDPGFYSRDQVEALLRKAFSAIQTLEFHINLDRSRGADGATALALCPAIWSYTARGTRTDVGLRFVLARRGERWTVIEIRETR